MTREICEPTSLWGMQTTQADHDVAVAQTSILTNPNDDRDADYQCQPPAQESA